MLDHYLRKAQLRQAELRYLSEMLPQLQKMAVDLDETLLSKLLEMAALEANLKLVIDEEYIDKIDNPYEIDITAYSAGM